MTSESTSPSPSLLSYLRATFSDAKKRKTQYWFLEILASLLSIATAVVPWILVASIAGVVSVACKVLSKIVFSQSKTVFRLAERLRRFDFLARTLDWPVPARDRVDLLLTISPSTERAARALAPREADYYANKGPPSTERLYSNMIESMFWTERLMSAMAKQRSKQLIAASSAVVLVLVGSLLLQIGDTAHLILKVVSAIVALLVAVDVLGEARSFARGEREIARLLTGITAEWRKADLSRDEGLRFLIEYNCLLADLPLIPDAVYEQLHDRLSTAWTTFAATEGLDRRRAA